MFSDRTSQVWKINPEILSSSEFNIQWDFESEGEFLHLAQLVDLIRNYKFKPSSAINLYLSYLPYARQDKIISNGTTFALSTFSTHLNYLKLDKIEILDAHSEKAIGLIDNSVNLFPVNEILMTVRNFNPDIICYPDAGAVKRYTTVYHAEYIYADKVRDQSTGQITSYKLNLNGKDIKSKRVLMIDDLIDGGTTFIKLSKMLKEEGSNVNALYVTHGIFSNGLKPLFEAGISRIFTKDGEASEINGNICYRDLYKK